MSWGIQICFTLTEITFVRSNDNTRFDVIMLLGIEVISMTFLLFLHLFVDKYPSAYDNFSETSKLICPDRYCSALNRNFFFYVGPLMTKGYSEQLDYSSTWSLDKRNHPDHLLALFASSLPPAEQQISENRWIPWLFIALLKSNWFFTLGAAVLAWMGASVMIFNPIFLKIVVDSVENDYPLWFCFGLVVVIVIVSLGTFSLCTRCDFYALLAYQNVHSILINVVYKKALKLSSSSRVKYSAGEIINLITTDVDRIREFWFTLQEYVYCPAMTFYCFVGLGLAIGHNFLYGLVIIICCVPANAYVMKVASRCETKQMELKDARLKLMTDVLSGIKVIKLYAWEEPMQERVADLRSQEVKEFMKANICYAVLEFIFSMCPLLAAVVSFVGFIIIDGEKLTPQVAFISLMLFNLLRFSVYRLSSLAKEAINTRISLFRIEEFLNESEISSIKNNIEIDDDEVVLEIQNGTFTWDEVRISRDEMICQLNDISFQIRKGELVGIVGRVGSGKSSLLSAIAGEMNKVSGGLYRSNLTLAYVPQESWIQNYTLKENVLFGKNFKEEFYRKTIDSCALKDDLRMLPAGDLTEIGERGLNLSGGQKARVALARAVYQDADLYLLDDTLSAVDMHVGAHIFENVIGNNGLLKEKTRLFALNSISFLSKCDRIIVLKESRIVDIGTFEELSNKKNTVFDDIVRELETKEHQEESGVVVTSEIDEMDDVLNELVGSPGNMALRRRTRTVSNNSDETAALLGRQFSNSSTHSHVAFFRSNSQLPSSIEARLVHEEDIGFGKVSSKMYGDYFKAFGIRLFLVYLFTMFIVRTSLEAISQIWLSRWSTAVSTNTSTIHPVAGLGIYAGFSLSSSIFIGLATSLIAFGSYNASRKLHDGFLLSLLRSPMNFFDTTPMGRILNRLSKDIQRIDNELPGKINFGFVLAADVIVHIASSVFVMPILGVLTVPVIFVFIFVVRFYTRTSVQIRRLCSKSWSAVTSHIQDSYIGAHCIRTFGVVSRFQQQMIDKGITSTECKQMEIISNRWIQLRMDMLTAIFSGCLTGAAIYMGHIGAISIGSVALIASTGTIIRGLLGDIARQVKDTEQSVVAVERIQEYTNNEREAEWVSESSDLRRSWPEKGEIKFEDFSLRYRTNTPLVLKHLNLKVNPGEKVGIVGRTGAGKTSLTMGLFRIIEPATGTILIDGVDFRTLGLHELRKALTIIPQDPVLFCGNLRTNLDPFNEFEDSVLWEAIEKAHLTKFVQEFPEKLSYQIGESGGNLSVGQRQLICLARAILRRKTKILVLDEATAAVDHETDQLIQSSIRTQFSNCTILTIAHRLNTILDYDKVLVMDSGEIKEFDSPKTLLEDKKSLFYGLAKEAKIV